MNKYQNIKRINGKLKTVKFPKITPSEKDIVILSKDSDRLDLLAQSYYSDQTLYWIIAIANNLGKGSVEIQPGTIIRIPTNYMEILRNYNNINS